MTLAVIAFIAFTIDSTTAQKVRASDQDNAEVRDPASNRLFWMSTGRVAAPGRGSIGIMGAPYFIPWAPYLTFVQGGYTPLEFLQLNMTGSFNYWSLGTKVQVFPTMGFLQGVALGADFGFYPQNAGIVSDAHVEALNVTVSFGGEPVEFHLNAMQVNQGRSNASGSFPTYAQIGMALQLDKSDRGGAKLLGELWYVNNYYDHGMELGLILMGIRNYTRSFVWEFAFLVSPTLSFGGHTSSSEKLNFIPYPYLSFMWFI